VVKVVGVVMERHATLVRCVDVESAQERHLRLDRIQQAGPA
jgi:hypothetical protein